MRASAAVRLFTETDSPSTRIEQMSKKKTNAQQAVKAFDRDDCIPNLGQVVHRASFAHGDVHTFPDGSIALHGDDCTFTAVLGSDAE